MQRAGRTRRARDFAISGVLASKLGTPPSSELAILKCASHFRYLDPKKQSQKREFRDVGVFGL
eukprot:15299241-Alexandrium_andersonii.AAC.1